MRILIFILTLLVTFFAGLRQAKGFLPGLALPEAAGLTSTLPQADLPATHLFPEPAPLLLGILGLMLVGWRFIKRRRAALLAERTAHPSIDGMAWAGTGR